MVTRNEALKLALEALEDPAILNGVNNAKFLIKQSLEHPQEARNFCFRCGKRTPDLAAIHTCTPPRGLELT